MLMIVDSNFSLQKSQEELVHKIVKLKPHFFSQNFPPQKSGKYDNVRTKMQKAASIAQMQNYVAQKRINYVLML